jgi:serine phosphatase RsbU (regulator of sigma subunit)
LSQPELPEDPTETRGRGLFLIYRYCDRWAHWRSDSGYCLELFKDHPEIFPVNPQEELVEALEEISLCYESLAAFYRLGGTLIRSESVFSFIEDSIRDFLPVIGGDYAALHFGSSLQVELLEKLNKLDICFLFGQGSKYQQCVAGSGDEFIWESEQEVSEDPELGLYRAGACLPIRAGGVVIGCLTVARRSNQPYFNAAQLNTARTCSDLIGIAVANANHEIVETREHTAQRELEIAAELQRNLLPASGLPETDRYRVFVRRVSAHEVGGDYVEACHAENGDLVLAIVDVMGKGVSAAIFAAMFRTALRMNLHMSHMLDELVYLLNRALLLETEEFTVFATCAIARIPPSLEYVEVVNAGHCPVVILEDRAPLREIAASGPPLGLFASARHEIERCDLGEGVRGIVMVTDGVYDWEENEEMWNWEKFRKFLSDSTPLYPESFWDALQNRIYKGTGGSETADDQTVLFWESKG